MAQRLVHYLIGETLDPGSFCSDKEAAARFRVGNLLPDAYGPGKPSPMLRRRTHFIANCERGRYSDFEGFRREYESLIPNDGLYLGYYLHLVEDACFRVFWHGLDLSAQIRSLEDVSFLHRDYHILNRHLVAAYGLNNALPIDFSIAGEPINAVFAFDLPCLLKDVSEDLAEETEGDTRFISAELLDRFIMDALPVCREALEKLLCCAEPLDPLSLVWKHDG